MTPPLTSQPVTSKQSETADGAHHFAEMQAVPELHHTLGGCCCHHKAINSQYVLAMHNLRHTSTNHCQNHGSQCSEFIRRQHYQTETCQSGTVPESLCMQQSWSHQSDNGTDVTLFNAQVQTADVEYC